MFKALFRASIAPYLSIIKQITAKAPQLAEYVDSDMPSPQDGEMWLRKDTGSLGGVLVGWAGLPITSTNKFQSNGGVLVGLAGLPITTPAQVNQTTLRINTSQGIIQGGNNA